MLDMTNVKTRVDAAAGVIVKEGDNGERLLLMIQRASDDHWPNHWEFPRGKCDQGGSPMGENTLKCCKREIKEETGLDVIPMYKIDEFQYLADGGTRLTTCYNFLCKMKDPNQKVKLSNEHKRFKWIQSVGEVELLALPDQKKTIKKILNRKQSISTQPDNNFTKNNMIEEYLSFLNEDEKPCWKGYTMVGWKMKGEKKVPNCVPVEKGEPEKMKPVKEEKENKPLNKPFRLPAGSNKKFGVYVKNDKGNVVKVTFGDPNLEIKRDDPERLKSFRARHGCDNPGPKWKAKYWSCRFWEKGISVTSLLKGKK